MIHLTPEVLGARLDGALSPAESDRVERHLAACAPCRDALAELAAQDASLKPALEHDPGEAYFEGFAARVEDRIRAAGLRGAQSRLGDGPWLGWLRSPRRVAWVGAVATVVLGAAVVLVTARLERPLSPDVASRLEQKAPGQAEEAPAEPFLGVAPPSGTPSPGANDQAMPPPAPDPLSAPGAATPARLQEREAGNLGAAAGREAAAPPAAGATRAQTSRLIEVRRTEGGEDVPVRSNELQFQPAPEAKAKQEEGAAGTADEARIVKPRMAEPMTKSLARAPAAASSPEEVAQKLQAGETRLCGRVLDPSGRPVQGAVVALANLGRTATTDAAGSFCLATPAGTHEITAMAVGFEATRMQVRAEGQTSDALVTLQPVPVLGARPSPARTQRFLDTEKKDAFSGVSEGARRLVDAATRLSGAARTARQFDAAAAAWQRVVAAVPAGAARLEALDRTAESRHHAWRLEPNARRAAAARAALEAYLAVAPPSERRELLERRGSAYR